MNILYLGDLLMNRCSNFVTKNAQFRRKLWVLRSMTPTRPYSINTLLVGNVDDDINICIAVTLLSLWNLHKRVDETNKLSVT